MRTSIWDSICFNVSRITPTIMMMDVPPKDTDGAKHTIKEDRDQHNDNQSCCTDKYNVIQDTFSRYSWVGFARPDTRNESALLFHIISHLNRVESD